MNFLSVMRNGLAAVALSVVGIAALAGPGHDHGDEAEPAAGGPDLPRFTAASELFELVGVIEGKRLTVYLDHAASNEPVKDAKVELEIGGVKVAVQPHADGEFDAELAQPLGPGVLPVMVTVSTAQQSDLLSGELDVHEDAPKTAVAATMDWKRIAAYAAGGVVALLVLALGIRMALRRRGAQRALAGAA
jgi:hypothetical protein